MRQFVDAVVTKFQKLCAWEILARLNRNPKRWAIYLLSCFANI